MTHRMPIILCLVSIFAHVSDRAASGQPAPKVAMERRIVGYIPDYRLTDVRADQLRYFTDVVIFSALVRPDGTADLKRLPAAGLQRIRGLQTALRFRTYLCVGGWERSAGFPAAAASPDARVRFAREMVRICQEYRFDGVDLDWEHPASAQEWNHFGELIAVLHHHFQPHGLWLTAAVTSDCRLPQKRYALLNAVNLMSYDHGGPHHSTLAGAESDIRSLLKQGADPASLILGVPFYGRHKTQRDKTLEYAKILSQFPTPPTGAGAEKDDGDEIDGYAFNGPATIAKKVALARRLGLGGIMIWEISQDTPPSDPRALLPVIAKVWPPASVPGN